MTWAFQFFRRPLHCEGPTYDPATDSLFWFDILEQKLLEKKLSEGQEVVHSLSEMASALAIIDADRQWSSPSRPSCPGRALRNVDAAYTH